MHVKPSQPSSADDRLRRELATKGLSPLAAARAGSGGIPALARVSRRNDSGDDPPARRRTGFLGARGCEICRGPVVTEGLCEPCRQRLVLPLVDTEAGKEAAIAYRIERAARQAAEKAEARKDSRSRAPRRGAQAAEDPAQEAATEGAYRMERSPEGRLFLRGPDGAGYLLGTGGQGFVVAQWILADGSPGGEESRSFVEDFLRARPEIGLSAGCADAVRALACIAA